MVKVRFIYYTESLLVILTMLAVCSSLRISRFPLSIKNVRRPLSFSGSLSDFEENKAITPRKLDYSAWYNDVIAAASIAETSPVRGCMIIKPWGMAIWELIKTDLDRRIRLSGAENAYFPLFIPMSYFSKESEHVEGFAKECAVVTHYRLKNNGKGLEPDEESRLEEPLVVRPTSETIIWDSFSNWIKSHRDLPLKINQWANVVRWEMRTRPFLRTSEFLWQEGHTAHATADDARATVNEMILAYQHHCERVLAMPTVLGVKSESERFAGALETYTIEALMQNGWALQAGTSHFLGQSFSKAFNVHFANVDMQRELVWATSWGVSTRLVGAMIMTHSDDKGLVLPPEVAPIQIVIVPVFVADETKNKVVLEKAQQLHKCLQDCGIRSKVDDRRHLRHGAKYFEWERKGVPLRLELGMRDISSNSSPLAVRIDAEARSKESQSLEVSNFANSIKSKLEQVQEKMLTRAKTRLEERIKWVASYDEMKTHLAKSACDPANAVTVGGLYLAPWCANNENEEFIKNDSKATLRCYPLQHNHQQLQGQCCFYSGLPATHIALFGRAF